MSMRVSATPLIANSLIVGDSGLGVLAENVPSTGENGPGIYTTTLTYQQTTVKKLQAV